MHDIYRGASAVLVFLGNSSECVQNTIDFIELAGSHPELHIDPSQKSHLSVRGLDLRSRRLLDDIIDFFDLPWWHRVWAVQEYALAREVIFQCGLRTVSNTIFNTAWNNLRAHGNSCCSSEKYTTIASPRSNKTALDAFFRFDSLQNIPRDALLSNVARFRSRLSFDHRDKIYGLMGLADSQDVGLIKADYRKSTEEVFAHFALETVKRTGHLGVLSYISAERQLADLPSYVPDWTVRHRAQVEQRLSSDTPISLYTMRLEARKLSGRRMGLA